MSDQSKDTLRRIEESVLGKDSGPIALRYREENRAAALALVRQARRSLYMISRDLDPLIYDTTEFVDTVKELATRSRYSEIQILVQETDIIIRQGHRLIELMRRLTSRIEIRVPDKEDSEYNEAIFMVDDVGYIRRELADRYEGVVDFNAPLQVRNMAKIFRDMWERGAPDPNLRRLHI